MLALLTMVAVAGVVFCSSLTAFSVLLRAYRRFRSHTESHPASEVSEMFLFIDSGQLLWLSLASSAGLGIAVTGVWGVLFGGLGCIPGFFLPRLVVAMIRRRRLCAFNGQLADALQGLAGAFRAGLSLPQALEQVAKDAPLPLALEFSLLVKELKLNRPLDDALGNMARRVGSEELELAVHAIQIARQLGGNLSEVLETIEGTVRERFRLEGHIDAVTAQGRLQGWVVSAMPLVLGLVFQAMRPDLMQPMLGHLFGKVLLAVIAGMLALGAFWIRRTVAIEV